MGNKMNKFLVLLVIAILAYMVSVWGIGLKDDMTKLQKDRQDRIEQILKGE
jgi:hypothetical protein